MQVSLPLHWCRNWSTGRIWLFWSPQGSHKQPHELSLRCNQLPVDSQTTKGILNKRASPLHAVSLNNQCDLGIHVYNQDIELINKLVQWSVDTLQQSLTPQMCLEKHVNSITEVGWLQRELLCVVSIPLEHYIETGPGANRSLPQMSCPVPCEEELTTHAR